MTVEGNEDTTTLAMVSDFTRPDPAVLGKTHGVLMACQYQGARSRRVINAKEIGSVVGMCPLRPRAAEETHPNAPDLYRNRFFVVQKLGFDMTWIGRGAEDPNTYDGNVI